MSSPQYSFAAPPETPAFRPAMQPPKRRLWLHILLFVATICTTWFVWFGQEVGWRLSWPPAFLWLAAQRALAYSFWVLLILTAHELGHYFVARRNRVKATLPYFIPLPLPPLGTVGAVIRMSPYIPNRRALFDIAVAGPLAGMVIAVPVVFWGMWGARYIPVERAAGGVHFGDPLLFQIAARLLLGPRPEGFDVQVGPMAFAGWVGLFVTALNLLPMSQLDGGHISYAVFGRHSRKIALAVFIGLGCAMLLKVAGLTYVLFLGLVWFVGLGHPPTLDDSVRLDATRRAIAVLALLIFILCFTPTPIIQEWPQ